MGGVEQAKSFYRFFMAPGMEHCGLGPGPNAIGGVFGLPSPSRDPEHDVVAALARWVEQGAALEQSSRRGIGTMIRPRGSKRSDRGAPIRRSRAIPKRGESQASSFVCAGRSASVGKSAQPAIRTNSRPKRIPHTARCEPCPPKSLDDGSLTPGGWANSGVHVRRQA